MYYPSEEGQIRTEMEKQLTVDLKCGTIGTADFSTPSLDDKRVGKPDGNGKKVSKIGSEKRQKTKEAYVKTLAKFGIIIDITQVDWSPYE
ncbi:MAG: hypothetical protein JWN78_407 [Bacteroidota bacterium]|nr:hypothetical protein [Bacteroidota bacterium]